MSAVVCADCGHPSASHGIYRLCAFHGCHCPAYRQEPAAVSDALPRDWPYLDRVKAENVRLRGQRDAALRQRDLHLGTESVAVNEARAENARLREDNARLRMALNEIRAWDCLNPPRGDLLSDLPWLRGVVDRALAVTAPTDPTEETK